MLANNSNTPTDDDEEIQVHIDRTQDDNGRTPVTQAPGKEKEYAK